MRWWRSIGIMSGGLSNSTPCQNVSTQTPEHPVLSDVHSFAFASLDHRLSSLTGTVEHCVTASMLAPLLLCPLVAQQSIKIQYTVPAILQSIHGLLFMIVINSLWKLSPMICTTFFVTFFTLSV